jgi:hypothetical protein
MSDEPWTRLEDETDKAYRAFCIYRDAGPDKRTHEYVREELGKASGYTRWLEEWSSKYDWVDRASAYDDHLEEQRRQEYEEEMTSGLAHAGARVRKLKDLHDRLEDELEENLWTEDVKIGPQGAQVRIKQYNTALVRDYLRSLKHIAKEVGGRKKQIDVSDTDDQVTFVLPENGREEGSDDD